MLWEFSDDMSQVMYLGISPLRALITFPIYTMSPKRPPFIF